MGSEPSRVECVLPLVLDTEHMSGSGEKKSELLQWRDGAPPSEIASPGHVVRGHFQLLDANQRIEVRRSGLFRLRLHVEQQEAKRGCLSWIPLEFVLEVNGSKVPMSRDVWLKNGTRRPPKSPYEEERLYYTGTDHSLPWKGFSIAELNFNRCDTMTVRWMPGARTETRKGRTAGLTRPQEFADIIVMLFRAMVAAVKQWIIGLDEEPCGSKLIRGWLVIEAIQTSP